MLGKGTGKAAKDWETLKLNFGKVLNMLPMDGSEDNSRICIESLSLVVLHGEKSPVQVRQALAEIQNRPGPICKAFRLSSFGKKVMPEAQKHVAEGAIAELNTSNLIVIGEKVDACM